MTRRKTLTALAATAAATAAAVATSARAADTDALTDLLKASSAEKKGVNVHINGGQQIGMLVTSLDTQYVQGRSQQYSRIVVRLTSIEAVTMA